jgi:hypothetical protein
VYEDWGGEGGVGVGGLYGEDDAVDGGGEGEVEGVTGDAAALVKAVGLEVPGEGGAGYAFNLTFSTAIHRIILSIQTPHAYPPLPPPVLIHDDTTLALPALVPGSTTPFYSPISALRNLDFRARRSFLAHSGTHGRFLKVKPVERRGDMPSPGVPIHVHYSARYTSAAG